jgi:DNA-binding response OmpR family regulator
MDGIALALAAKRDFPDLTILLMTGFADQRERAQGLDAIVEDVLTKPFSLADARAAVRRALRGDAAS